MWSPYEIGLILHIYASTEPFPYPHPDEVALKNFVHMGLIVFDEDSASAYRITAKGTALVLLWKTTPVPQEAFIHPTTKEVICAIP